MEDITKEITEESAQEKRDKNMLAMFCFDIVEVIGAEAFNKIKGLGNIENFAKRYIANEKLEASKDFDFNQPIEDNTKAIKIDWSKTNLN